MTPSSFTEMTESVFQKCRETLNSKSGYGTEADRLQNFKRAGALQRVKATTALSGMLAKHTVALNDYLSDYEEGPTAKQEEWEEKIIDSINYLLLLRGLLVDEGIL